MSSPMKLKIAFFLVLLALALPAGAATKTSVANGNWTAGATWSPAGIPAAGDRVIIATGTTVTVNANVAITDLVVQTGAVLQGDGTPRTFTMGKGGGEDLTNDGTINFGGATPVTLSLNKDMQVGGGTMGTWNFSVIDLNTRKLRFTNGTSFTLSLDGAGDPIQALGEFNTTGGCCVANANVTVNYNGTAAQTLSNSANVIYGGIAVNNAAGVSLTRNLNATNLLGDVSVQSGVLKDAGFSILGQVAKTFLVADGATFEITNGAGMVTGFGTKSFQPASTVDYRLNGIQPVSLETYGNLRLSVGGTKTPPAGTYTIVGNFTVAAGVTYASIANTTSVNIGDSLSNSGTFNVGTGTYTFNGAGIQTLSGVTSFTNLAIANSGVTAGAGLTLTADTTVTTALAGTLTLTSGVINTGSFKVIVTRSCTAALSRVGGHVAGNLQLRFPTGPNIACTFHVGDAFASGRYTPVTITFASVTAAGDLVGRTTAGDHPDIGNSTLDSLKSVNRYWTLTNSGTGFTTYSAAFTYVVPDNDAGTTPANYLIAKGDGCTVAEAGCTWTLPTVSGSPTNVGATATGMTSFSRFIVGERASQLNNFLINVGGGTASTCFAKTITLTARKIDNTTLTTYAGTVTITTSTNHGNWSVSIATGSFTAGAADSGAANYIFNGAGAGKDNGVISLNLSNVHADDLTITVADTSPAVSSTSATLSYRDNVFVITATDSLGTTAVAGRNHAMKAEMWKKDTTSGNCSVDTSYTGNKNLDAWYVADVNHPASASAPAISTGTPPATCSGAPSLTLGTAVPVSNPASNNLANVPFSSGVWNFCMSTSDVGKFAINLRDDTRIYATGVDISGTSSTLTVRPFGIAITGIQKGATVNPSGTSTSGGKFVPAGDTAQAAANFQVTVGGYRWQATDDANNDGVPDSGANITDNGLAPRFAWTTTLSATNTAPYFTPATGTLGTLTGTTSIATASYAGGQATVSNLAYSQVGSFQMQASVTNYLNSVGVNFAGVSVNATGSATQIGRFYPDHFTLVSGSVAAACVGGGFTYMDQPNLGVSFNIEARNSADALTSNYGSGYTVGTVNVLAENNDDGVDLSARLTVSPATWAGGVYNVNTGIAKFSRAAAADGPYDLLQLGTQVVDADSPVLAARDMNPTSAGVCGGACVGKTLTGTTKLRFGRLVLGNAFGSELLDLPIPMQTQYYNSSGVYVTNVDDICTTLSASNLAFAFVAGTPNLVACETSITPGTTLYFTSGKASATAPPATTPLPRLTKPGAGNNGAVDLTVNLGAASGNTCIASTSSPATGANKPWLQWKWLGATFDKNPAARATFGVFKNADEFIYLRENF